MLRSSAVTAVGPLIEKFAPSAGRWLGCFGMAVGVAMVVLEPLTSERTNVTVILLGVALICVSWVVMVRPRAAAHERGLLLQNLVRDAAIPWPRIERCTVGQTLIVTTTEAESFHGLGVTRSARTQMREQYGTSSIMLGGMRATGRKLAPERGPSMAEGEWQAGTYTSYVESRIAGLASKGERGGQDETYEPFMAWAPVPLLLLAVAVACVLAAIIEA